MGCCSSSSALMGRNSCPEAAATPGGPGSTAPPADITTRRSSRGFRLPLRPRPAPRRRASALRLKERVPAEPSGSRPPRSGVPGDAGLPQPAGPTSVQPSLPAGACSLGRGLFPAPPWQERRCTTQSSERWLSGGPLGLALGWSIGAGSPWAGPLARMTQALRDSRWFSHVPFPALLLLWVLPTTHSKLQPP